MKLVWTAVATCLTLALIGTADGQDKKAPDKAKLVGVWDIVKSKGAPPGATVEFTKDGKLILRAKINDKELTLEGSYKLEGAKLDIIFKKGGEDSRDVHTIKTLTDTTLVTIDEKGQQDEFKRRK